MLNNFITSIKLLFSRNKELYSLFYETLGFYPSDISLYQEAMLHSSAQHTNKNGNQINNERLEFLGDAILDATVADIVFKHFPESSEGFLTTIRAKIVQRDALNKVARKLNIPKLLTTSNQDFPPHSFIYGNAVEALIGAIYLDKGYRVTKQFILTHIISTNLDIIAEKNTNYKSQIIEWTQKNKCSIVFDTSEIEKKEGRLSGFSTCLTIEDGKIVTFGKGSSKKESQQQAAKHALSQLQ